MALTQEEKDLKNLFPGSSISNSARQISEDPDLFGMLVSLYERNGNTERVRRLKKIASKPNDGKTGKRATLRAFLSSDKRARREFAVEARNFLSKRQAGDAVEKKRLSLGRGASGSRSASIIKAAKGADTQVTALGRTGLGAESASRVRNMLGQVGALG